MEHAPVYHSFVSVDLWAAAAQTAREAMRTQVVYWATNNDLAALEAELRAAVGGEIGSWEASPSSDRPMQYVGVFDGVHLYAGAESSQFVSQIHAEA